MDGSPLQKPSQQQDRRADSPDRRDDYLRVRRHAARNGGDIGDRGNEDGAAGLDQHRVDRQRPGQGSASVIPEPLQHVERHQEFHGGHEPDPVANGGGIAPAG
jgi:hypothetical protein